MPIKIALAEDNPNMHEALLMNLSLFDEIDLVFSATNGIEFLEKLESNPLPQVVLMDIEMPLQNGIITTLKLLQKNPDIKVIMLTAHDKDQHIFEALKAGAVGYLLKGDSPNNIVKAITQTQEGFTPMSPAVAQKVLQFVKNAPITTQKTNQANQFTLTKRETEILKILALGKAYKNIANELFLSEKTVKKHIENID